LGSLDNTNKTLIITEGLVSYFDLPTIRKVLVRITAQKTPLIAGSFFAA
jgi:O-methyltransferase involved in polyketide biosynthesis